MNVERANDPKAFLDRALHFLMQHEAANNLLIAIPMAGTEEDYYTFVDGGKVVGAAMNKPPYSAVISWPFPEEALPMLAAVIPDAPGILAANELADAFVNESGRTITDVRRTRIYQVDEVRASEHVHGRMLQADSGHHELLLDWFTGFLDDIDEPTPPLHPSEALDGVLDQRHLYYWEDGCPVSVAGWTRPTPNGACITMVYTPPEHRRKGYAGALTAALSQRLLGEGRTFVCLFTDLANPTSNGVYQRIGYRPVLDLHHYRF